jgi:HK97 family phage major capsid protein
MAPKEAMMATVIPSQKGYRGKTAEEQESFEFIERLRRGGQAYRVLEEHEAAEGGPMVPVPLLEKIFSMKFERSLIDKIGIKRWPTDKLITNIASEATGHAIQAVVAEEDVHVANEPALLLTQITVTKYGSMVTCTEELLEDQSLFQAWLPSALAQQMALQENAILYATLAAAGTLGVHLAAAHTLTEAQLNTFYTAMPAQWREGACVVTNDATMLAMRALLIATPRAYPPPELAATVQQPYRAMWMGLPMFFNTNWPAITGSGDAVEIITMVHPDAVVYVQRHGIEILRDDYGDSLAGRTRFFGTARWCIAVIHALGVVHLTDHA